MPGRRRTSAGLGDDAGQAESETYSVPHTLSRILSFRNDFAPDAARGIREARRPSIADEPSALASRRRPGAAERATRQDGCHPSRSSRGRSAIYHVRVAKHGRNGCLPATCHDSSACDPIVAPRATRRSRRLPSRSAPVGAGILCVACLFRADPSPSCANGSHGRVRAMSPKLGAAVTLGCHTCAVHAFRKIVGQIDRSSGIVYVNWARLGGLPAGVEAALQAGPSRGADGTRYLQVRVRLKKGCASPAPIVNRCPRTAARARSSGIRLS